MSSSSTQTFTIPSSLGTNRYSASLDSLLFRVIPLSETPFEQLHSHAKQYIDVTTTNARTSSTIFISSSPPAEPSTSSRESNQTKQDEADFDEYLRLNPQRFILDASKRMTYCYHLQNPSMAPYDIGAKQQADSNAKHTAQTYYELQDSQIYQRAEFDKATRRQKPPKYIITYSDAFQLIADVYEALLYFSNSISF